MISGIGSEPLIINQLEIVIRLLVAALLGALVGFEREQQNQPAGLRTHTILAVGAALAMMLSINIASQFQVNGVKGDPARLAAQVVSGIGFLGAGAILRFGNNIRGLTTAGSLWTLAIIGMSVGAGYILTGAATTVILLIALTFLDAFEKRFIKTYKTINVSLSIDDRPGILDEIRHVIVDKNTTIMQTSVTRDLENDRASFNLVVKTLEKAPIDQMVTSLVGLKGIKSFKIE